VLKYQSLALAGWQAEKESYIKKLEAESKRVSQLRREIRGVDTKDQEIHDLHQRLTDLQVLTLFSIFWDMLKVGNLPPGLNQGASD